MKNKKQEEERKEFLKNMYFRYEINWGGGVSDVFEPNDAPIRWPDELVESCAIVCASNPNGQTLSAEKNEKLNRELASLLDIIGIQYLEVRRLSLDENTLEPDGKDISRAFFLLGVTETQAFVLSSQFMQKAFVFYESDCPDDLKIELCGCYWKFPNMRAVIFRYE